MKQLLILGDSFCHGVGTSSPFKHPDNIHHAFGKYVADRYQLEYVNLAEPGISILRTIELGYQYLISNHQKVELALIGWTNPDRVGVYSTDSMLQILPSYTWLGNTSDTDVFVEYDRGVKFITDKNNKNNLHALLDLHKIFVHNNFFDQKELYFMCISLFKSWLREKQIKFVDFSVFKNVPDVQLSASFTDIMRCDRHPSKQEQKIFAELLLKEMR